MRAHVDAITDNAGMVKVSHSLGKTPSGILLSPGPQFSPELNEKVRLNWVQSDESTVSVYVSDGYVPLCAKPVTFFIEAFA